MSDEDLSIEEELDLGHYEGSRNDEQQRHGFGKAFFANGDTYEGNYENGKRHGKGSYRFINGCLFEGTYLWNKKDGPGTMYYPDGSKYEGNWGEDCKQGVGTYKYVNGDTYEGEWFRNRKNGHGTYIFKETNAKIGGVWHNGKLNGPAKITLSNHIFEGGYHDDNLKGPGRYIFPVHRVELVGKYTVIEKEEELIPEEGRPLKVYESKWKTKIMRPMEIKEPTT